jgi:hypothetical protein
VLPGLHHLLMIRSHLMLVRQGLGERHAGGREGKHGTDGNEFTGDKHGKTSSGVDRGESTPPTPPRCMIEIMRSAIFASPF